MARTPMVVVVAWTGVLLVAVGCGGSTPSSPGGAFVAAPAFRAAFGSNPDGGFEGLRGVAVGRDGRVYAYDEIQDRVQILAADGRFLGAFDGRLSGDPTGTRTPSEFLMAPDGTLYVVDPGGRAIEQWSASGARLRRIVPTTPESPAGFSPERLAVTAAGVLFVTDPEHHHVVRLEADGTYDTHWGRDCDEPDGFRAMGPIAAAPDGTVWVINVTRYDELKQFTADGVFIRSVSALPTLSPGFPHFCQPTGLLFHPDGRMLVLDDCRDLIFELTATGEELRTWDLTTYRLNSGGGCIRTVEDGVYLALGHDGLLLYGVYQLGEIRRIDPGAGIELEPLGHAFGSGVELNAATDIRFESSGRILALRSDGGRLWHFDPNGTLARMEEFQNGCQAEASYIPSAISIGPEGALYFLDRDRQRVLKESPDGERTEIVSWKNSINGFRRVQAFAIASDGTIGLASPEPTEVAFLALDGRLLALHVLPATPGEDAVPPAVLEVDRADRFWLLDPATRSLMAWTTDGTSAGRIDLMAATSGALRSPVDLAIDTYDEFHLLDAAGEVFRFAADGRWLGRWGAPGLAPGALDRPVALAVDSMGRVALLDRYGSRVQIFAGRS